MSLNRIESTAFEKQMKKGKIYEAKVQQEIAECSPGSVFRNVRVGSICEFDLVVADYPVLSFIEIKFYRSNLSPNKVRSAIRKFRNHCKRVTEEGLDWKRKWIPYVPDTQSGIVTNKDILFKKLSLPISSEGWRYRMILIVPDKSIDAVLDSLNETKPFTPQKQGQNLRLVDGIPILVIPEKRIKAVFE